MQKTISRQVLTEAIENLGLDPEDAIHAKYSGRGMYGAECFGVVGSGAELLALGTELASLLAEKAADEAVTPSEMLEAIQEDLGGYTQMLQAARMDNMANDIIVYFPGWTLADD